MLKKWISATLCSLVALTALTQTGCIGITLGPDLGLLAIPIPVSPYFQQKHEDKARFKERYGRAPILGPLQANAPHVARDEPSDEEVMAAMERAHRTQGGIPFLHEIQRNNVRIVKEKISDYIDPPRVIPLIGPAQLHHVHYKCTVFYTNITRVGWPIPHTITDEDAREVIYIDHNHFHMVGNVDTGAGAPF